MNKSDYFAEVIESSLDHYTAQSWQWDHCPAFGSLIQVSNSSRVILGVVTHIQTGSIDPTRSPFPYQKTEEELLAEQPQIFEFLKTTFTVQITGYQNIQDAKIFYILPPTPCKIHSFVSECPQELTSIFFDHTDFLHLLFAFSNNIPNLDELLLAIIKQLVDKKTFQYDKIDNICRSFTLLTGNDYRRLKLFLGRMETIL